MGQKKTYTAKITDYPHQEYDINPDTGEIIKMTETVVQRTVEVPVMEDYVDVKLPRKFRFNN